MTAVALAFRSGSMDGIGTLIQRWMTRTGRNQTDLAEAVDVSQKTISRWKNEDATPDVKHRPALREALGLDQYTFDLAIEESQRRMAAEKRSMARESRRPRLAGIYAIGSAAQREWIGLVRRDDSLSRDLRDILTLLPEYIDDSQRERSADAFVTLQLLAHDSPELDLDGVAGLWDDLLSTPYVERIGAPVEWVLRLKFPQH